jgi:xylulose-5-phosphate/fructose-6-phosphate phosphoketolase
MLVLNTIDRFQLFMALIDRVTGLGDRAAWLRQEMVDHRTRHWAYVREHGEDLPEVRNWVWPAAAAAAGTAPQLSAEDPS